MPAAIGGSTFYDVNNNGIWNAPEAAAPGVQVSLLPMAGSPASATTDSAGHYSFPGLSTGSYSVSFTAPSGYTVSNPVGGMASVALGTSDATLDAALVGSGSGSGSGTVIGSATTSTGSQSTFTLNGMIGSMHYNIPWGSVDPAQASQSLPLSNFSITVPYGTASQATLTPLNASFTTSPTVQFASGVFTGVNFSIDTSTIAGFDYASISMSGSTLTAVLPAPNIPLTSNVVAAVAELVVDFAQAKVGVVYRIEIKLFDNAAVPAQVGNTQTIDLGAAATVDVLRGLFKTAVTNTGLTCDFPAGNSKMAVISGPAGGATAFGKIEYRTLVQGPDGWVQNNTFNGPAYVGRTLTPSFYVNGTKITP